MNEHYQRHLQIGRQFYAAGNNERAAREFESALGHNPDSNYARLLLARCYLNQKKFKEARREVESALAHDANDADAHYVGAFCAPKPRLALESIDRALAISPHKAAYHEQRAFVLTRLSKWAPALESANRALEIAPDSASAHRQMAGVLFGEAAISGLMSRKKRDQAAFHVERALELEPDSSYSQMALARLRAYDLEYEDALDKWAEALRLDPTDAYAQNELRKVKSQAQMERFALRLWRYSFRFLPWPVRLPLLWSMMGLAFYWGVAVPRGRGFWSGEPFPFLAVWVLGAMMTPLLLRDWLRFVPDRFLGAVLMRHKKPPLR